MSHVKILTASVYANSPLWHLSITPTYVFRVQFVFQNYNYALKVRFHLNRKKKKEYICVGNTSRSDRLLS